MRDGLQLAATGKDSAPTMTTRNEEALRAFLDGKASYAVLLEHRAGGATDGFDYAVATTSGDLDRAESGPSVNRLAARR